MTMARSGFFSRRGFLIGSGGAAIIAVAAGGMGLRFSRSEDEYRRVAGSGPDPEVFDYKELAVMAMAADAIVAPTNGMPSVEETMVARRVDKELSYSNKKLRSDMKSALAYLEIKPALTGRVSPFTILDREARQDVLSGMNVSDGTDRQVYAALKFVAGFFYYSDDRTWPIIGYTGPSQTKKFFPAGNRIENIVSSEAKQ